MKRRLVMTGIGFAAVMGQGVSLAQVASSPGVGEPTVVDGELVFPDGTPRYLTEAERAYLKSHPLSAPVARGPFSTPTGPVHCTAEYEPVEGILLTWKSFTSIITQMARWITTDGNADVYIALDSTSQQASATSALTAGGVNMSRVRFVIRSTNTVWIRDYGPRYIYEGNCRAIIDHVYNRPRPLDDAYPAYFAQLKRHARYNIPLVHGGGNYHLSALGESFCTRLINNENPGLTEQQIHDYWDAFQNLDTTFFNPFPTTVDLTQHIDMWMEVTGDRSVVISDWPFNVGSTQDVICDGAAAALEAQGWTVFRVPARSVGGNHYTYTNVVICNNVVIIPTYTNSSVTQHNTPALAVWQQVYPNKIIRQVNCEAMVASAGVMHCICMHMPSPMNGVNPSVYLRNLRGGETVPPGAGTTINWISDDDALVTSVEMRLSVDSGATYPFVIASNAADDGAEAWNVPDVSTTSARLRLIVRDADGHIGMDQSDSDVVISGAMSPCPGDYNASGSVDSQDLFDFLTAFFGAAGDFNGDATTNSQDFFDFLAAFFAGC
ncbi:MAG: agmatine deiminase family protein [Phycisphaerales bacterium]